jgi:hypothetical protein
MKASKKRKKLSKSRTSADIDEQLKNDKIK